MIESHLYFGSGEFSILADSSYWLVSRYVPVCVVGHDKAGAMNYEELLPVPRAVIVAKVHESLKEQ